MFSRFKLLVVPNYRLHCRTFSQFVNRHIGISENEKKEMLKECNVSSMNKLITEATSIPKEKQKQLYLKSFPNEHSAQNHLYSIMEKNKNVKSYLGQGYYNSILPFPIKRYILENPKWYTAYTPYQAEISQGRLESQYNYQQVIKDLTGMDVSNASLLDEASASAEVINICYQSSKQKKKTFLVSDKIHPQVLEVLKTKTQIFDIQLVYLDYNKVKKYEYENLNIDFNDVCGYMFQYPDTEGNIQIPQQFINFLNENKILVACSSDLLALTQLKSPQEIGASIAFGNAQRFGVPLWYGGPHPAFFAVKQELIRYLPGKMIGTSVDSIGNPVYRLGLQTREQHIRHDKATSNICTSQSLLTNVVSFYAMYHGPEGLKKISDGILKKTNYLRFHLEQIGFKIKNKSFFDTLTIELTEHMAHKIYTKAKENDIIVRNFNNNIVISIDETTHYKDIYKLLVIFSKCMNPNYELTKTMFNKYKQTNVKYIEPIKRETPFLSDELFNKYNTEANLTRYIFGLQNKDYTLCEGMIPLGSCTMKLNSVFELEPLSWKNVTEFHPYLPSEYAQGYQTLIEEVGEQLKQITGFDAVSFQSNSGSMGEYSGLLTIKKYFMDHNQANRNICLIPKSAHGTNFASAKQANYKIVKFDDTNMTTEKFKKIMEKHEKDLACLMITYPNTNGTFQENITELCEIIHRHGGMVYMDGANMNAQVGITSPALVGADVCHLNLHKTFCIPHGGGGPGMGPILCNYKLAPYLPKHVIQNISTIKNKNWSVSASEWSSASLLTIPYLYISTMGSEGLKKSTETAILSANYLKTKLESYYTIIDVNSNNRVAHEFIIDTTEFKDYNINDVDISKRLIDYSFHPPTMSWPRQNVLMFEPTESESKEELDRLIEALISIKQEIDEIKYNQVCSENNVLKNAPHTIQMMSNWNYPYSIQKACYPVKSLEKNKFWSSVGRVNDALGDKKLLKK